MRHSRRQLDLFVKALGWRERERVLDGWSRTIPAGDAVHRGRGRATPASLAATPLSTATLEHHREPHPVTSARSGRKPLPRARPRHERSDAAARPLGLTGTGLRDREDAGHGRGLFSTWVAAPVTSPSHIPRRGPVLPRHRRASAGRFRDVLLPAHGDTGTAVLVSWAARIAVSAATSKGWCLGAESNHRHGDLQADTGFKDGQGRGIPTKGGDRREAR